MALQKLVWSLLVTVFVFVGFEVMGGMQGRFKGSIRHTTTSAPVAQDGFWACGDY